MSGAVQSVVTVAGRGCVAALALALVLHGSTKRPTLRQSAAPASSPAPAAVRTAPSVAPVPGIPDPPEAPPGMCAATNWWRRGAFSDWRRVDFPEDWSFPWGTNRLRSAAILARGEVRPLGDPTPVASVGVPLGLVPLEGVLWYGPTPSNTYAFAWRRALAGRDRARPVDARIELFRNGDAIVSTNGVSRRIPRELPFAHDGYGQDADWVRANFADAEAILRVGYANWVGDQVGTGLANGLYRFEAVFPEDPPEATRLVVGDLSVCVTNAGAYAFVLEKGREYRFRTEPHDGTVRYAVRDDMGADAPAAHSAAAASPGAWTAAGGGLSLVPPSGNAPGSVLWMPSLEVSPGVDHLGPGAPDPVFTATLADCAGEERVSYLWTTDDPDLLVSDPYASTIRVTPVALPGWRESSLSVTATFGTNALTSTLRFTYGRSRHPQARLSLSAPRGLIRRDLWMAGSRPGEVAVTLDADCATSGVVRVWLVSGGGLVEIGRPLPAEFAMSGRRLSASVPVVGVACSAEEGDVRFACSFTPDGASGPALEAVASCTVYAPGEVSVPGAPGTGLAVVRGASVGVEVGMSPSGTSGYAVEWMTARRRTRDGYDPWRLALRAEGPSASLAMGEAGVFAIRARTVCGTQSNEVEYVHREDEPYVAAIGENQGPNRAGDRNHVGVASTERLLAIRNEALRYLNRPVYRLSERLWGRNGFSSVPANIWKCNAFVADIAVNAGCSVPALHVVKHRFPLPDTRFPPLANEWANGSPPIEGWLYLGAEVCPEPGFISAHPNPNGMGHVGIVDYDGWVISARGDGVTRYSRQMLDGTSGYSKPKEEE